MYKPILSLMTLSLSSLLLTSCAAIVVGAVAAVGTYAYMDGWLERDYKTSVDQAYSACLSTCDAMGLTVVEKEKRIDGADIKAKDSSTNVWFDLDQEEDGYVSISVRYGLTGDEEASRRIHENIQSRL